MIGNYHLIDELGEIRDQIETLKAREKELADLLLSACRTAASGERYRVLVRRRHIRELNPKLLPRSVLNDPKYYALEEQDLVITGPIDAMLSARAGGAVRQNEYSPKFAAIDLPVIAGRSP